MFVIFIAIFSIAVDGFHFSDIPLPFQEKSSGRTKNPDI